ncbi:MAG: phosphoribosylaminoimidazolesuccinocarboxamide synthase [Defluviitaleaceae bacterium]|nr:phosphoribosylaminoimidazolesuccinocarboxamide synthase [Defluviitaleaceae bacterium]
MKHVYEGKTKSVYELPDGNYLLKFKDDATGTDGVFDPGSNTVSLSIAGLGQGGLRLTEHFFKIIEDAGIHTHFVSADIPNATMTVKPAMSFGGGFGKGFEVICRLRATGSFVKRYGTYVTDGQDLNGFVEVTLKDDAREDPPITKDALEILGIMAPEEYETLKALTRRIAGIMKDEFAKKGAELYDIKFEFGKLANGEIVLIDEISGGNMRVYNNGMILHPMEIVEFILGK